jgi:hypothetical protein
MDDKLKMQRALLDHLEQESEKIQSLMDELLKSMDTIPSEQRHGTAWEANTNRFLELVERSGDAGGREGSQCQYEPRDRDGLFDRCA